MTGRGESQGGEAVKEAEPGPYDFEHPSLLFRLEDALKGLLGGPLLFGPFFERRGGFRGDERVLDFGCGGGVSTRSIAASLGPGGSVTGVDTSAFFVEKAKRRLRPHAKASALCGDLRELGLPSGSFDLVSIVHVLHDIPPGQRPATVQALVRVLPPGGRMWVLEPTRERHGMPAGEVRSLMAAAGMRELSSRAARASWEGTFLKDWRPAPLAHPAQLAQMSVDRRT